MFCLQKWVKRLILSYQTSFQKTQPSDVHLSPYCSEQLSLTFSWETFCLFLVISPSLSLSLFLSDRHQRELPDHVGHYLQSLTPPASCDSHQDWLEQDPELQDWKGNAKCLNSREEYRQITLTFPLPNNVAWLDSCIVFVQ